MSDRRKNTKKRKLYLAGYLCLCLSIILLAYFQLSRMARDYNTRHLELITGLYAEKMNDSMEYLLNYAQDNVKVAQAMEDKTPSQVLARMEKNLDGTVFCGIGLIGEKGNIYGSKYAAADIRQEGLDKQALEAEEFFYSDPYQSSETGSMIVTIFVPVPDSSWLHTIYVSVKVENLRQFGVYDLLRGKISVHLLKADSENFVTCISNSSSTENFEGSWNNLLLQQKYFQYNDGYSYSQWVKDMRSGKTDGRFSASIHGVESTISYRSITSMPGWYVIVELANKDISDITQQFSLLGGIFGSILVGITLIYMLSILLLEKKDKKIYMGLSATDPLTELLNRRALQNAVEEELKKKGTGYFIFIDIDNFKTYNDTYGHNNGDLCLKHCARIMKKCFPEDSILGRYGGDEFVVCLKGATQKDAYTYMQEFQSWLTPLILSTGEVAELSVSAGGAAYPDQGEDFVSLCRSADAALYKVKQNGKGDFRVKG